MELVHPFLTPNGIALSPDENTLYVAETKVLAQFGIDQETSARLKAEGITGGRH